MKDKLKTLAALGVASAMFDVNLSMPLTASQKGINMSRGMPLSNKCKKWRDKERKAKQARKLNWN